MARRSLQNLLSCGVQMELAACWGWHIEGQGV